MNYPMYGNGNPFIMNDLQNMRDRIDKQMQQIQQQQQQNQYQMQQPQAITQNFQIAPTQTSNNEMDAKYVENGDEVNKTLIFKNTIFLNRDMSLMWLKNVAGDIKKYSLMEIVELDPKDKEIAELKQQITNMQNMILTQNENKSNAQNQIINTENKIEKKTNRKEG